MKLICGLGNPGRDYARHRHNLGFMAVDELCRRARVSLDQEKFDARIALGTIAGERVLLLEPLTYMNGSGLSVVPAARFYKLEPADVLVVHDELDLPFGRVMLKLGGGAGGHNGLSSIIEQWGIDGFARLRLGIGKPEGPGAKERVISHVLSPFTLDEQRRLPELVALAADAAEAWLRDGLASAMNRYNRRLPSPAGD